MWSNQYWYYNIRSDANYSHSLPTNEIIAVLENIQVLRKEGFQMFRNQEDFPWLYVACVFSDNGNFSCDPSYQTEQINLIDIVASRRVPENERRYLELLKSIANRLGWELVLEEDDNGNEDVKLN